MTQPDTKPMTLDEDVEARFDKAFAYFKSWSLFQVDMKQFLATEIKAAEQRGAEREAKNVSKKLLRLAKKADKRLQQYQNEPPSSGSQKWIEVITVFEDLLDCIDELNPPIKETKDAD